MWRLLKTIKYIRNYTDGKIDIDDCIRVENGRIWFMGGIDCVLMTTDSWGELIKGLLEIHGPAIISTMKMAYKKCGFREMKDGKKIVPKDKLDILFKIWIDTGFVGEILEIKVGKDDNLERVENLHEAFIRLFEDKEINKLVVRVKDSFSVRALREIKLKTDFPACIVEPSHTCGALEAIFGGKWEVEETMCQAKGDKFCEWVFKKS